MSLSASSVQRRFASLLLRRSFQRMRSVIHSALPPRQSISCQWQTSIQHTAAPVATRTPCHAARTTSSAMPNSCSTVAQLSRYSFASFFAAADSMSSKRCSSSVTFCSSAGCASPGPAGPPGSAIGPEGMGGASQQVSHCRSPRRPPALSRRKEPALTTLLCDAKLALAAPPGPMSGRRGEQRLQKSLPQPRQWCRLRTMLNAVPQAMHEREAESGSHAVRPPARRPPPASLPLRPLRKGFRLSSAATLPRSDTRPRVMAVAGFTSPDMMA
mmetsp:Transcript_44789/g.115905  ORF Transcript_44789/g.115905 Transcript_44789/m.115905 type:complete len:271 (+) Transcript_44789:285-1097(+)